MKAAKPVVFYSTYMQSRDKVQFSIKAIIIIYLRYGKRNMHAIAPSLSTVIFYLFHILTDRNIKWHVTSYRHGLTA